MRLPVATNRLGRTVAALAVVLVVTVVPAPAVDAQVIAVTTTADGGGGSLRAAVDQANSSGGADVVVLAPGAEYVLSACGSDGLVSTGGPLTIEGNRSTIRQTCAGERVLRNADAGALTVVDLTITGGDAPTDGGAILSTDGPVSIVGSTLTANRAAGYGGGVFHDSDTTLTVDRSVIRDNQAFDYGGGVGVYGGLVMTDTVVEGNTVVADNAYGGGIYAHPGDATPAHITGSTVRANHADGSAGLGGGIYVDADALRIDTSTVADNTAGGDGGGIYAYYDTTITRSTLSGNRSEGRGGAVFSYATPLDVVSSTVVANTAGVAGGGVYAEGFDLALAFATFDANTAPTGAHLELGGATLTTFGTVLADPIGGPGCSGVATSSRGYNYEEATDTCGLRGATDVVAGAPADLGALTDNGGPTPTEAPGGASPLLDAIPAGESACSGVDQRGVVRPQGGGCDIGAVEAGSATGGPARPVSARPVFTG